MYFDASDCVRMRLNFILMYYKKYFEMQKNKIISNTHYYFRLIVLPNAWMTNKRMILWPEDLLYYSQLWCVIWKKGANGMLEFIFFLYWCNFLFLWMIWLSGQKKIIFLKQFYFIRSFLKIICFTRFVAVSMLINW